MKVDSLLADAIKVEEGAKFEAEKERKEDFANTKAKFDVKCKLQDQTAEKCPECEMWKINVEDLEDTVRKSNVDLESQRRAGKIEEGDDVER